jgi:hypothetical protein
MGKVSSVPGGPVEVLTGVCTFGHDNIIPPYVTATYRCPVEELQERTGSTRTHREGQLETL